jgi:hypothetical protein
MQRGRHPSFASTVHVMSRGHVTLPLSNHANSETLPACLLPACLPACLPAPSVQTGRQGYLSSLQKDHVNYIGIVIIDTVIDRRETLLLNIRPAGRRTQETKATNRHDGRWQADISRSSQTADIWAFIHVFIARRERREARSAWGLWGQWGLGTLHRSPEDE